MLFLLLFSIKLKERPSVIQYWMNIIIEKTIKIDAIQLSIMENPGFSVFAE